MENLISISVAGVVTWFFVRRYMRGLDKKRRQ